MSDQSPQQDAVQRPVAIPRSRKVAVLLCAGLAGLLEAETEPVTAVEIAERLNLRGNREWQRRQVRLLVDAMRTEGLKICAGNPVGYWLAQDDGEWSEYQAAVKRRIVFRFARRNRQIDAARDKAAGQGELFGKGQASTDAFRR